MRWSPAQLRCLIDLYSLPKVQVPESIAKDFLANELITQKSDTEWRTTKRGDALVDMLCDTPLPESEWCDPRTKTVIKRP